MRTCKIRYGYLNPFEINNSVNLEAWWTHHSEEIHRLKKSIIAEGLRNPLIIECLDLGDFVSLYCRVGHNRLAVSQELKLKEVPVIVNDLADYFTNWLLLEDLEQIKSVFTDLPRIIKIRETGVTMSEPLIKGNSWWKNEDFRIN